MWKMRKKGKGILTTELVWPAAPKINSQDERKNPSQSLGRQALHCSPTGPLRTCAPKAPKEYIYACTERVELQVINNRYGLLHRDTHKIHIVWKKTGNTDINHIKVICTTNLNNSFSIENEEKKSCSAGTHYLRRTAINKYYSHSSLFHAQSNSDIHT